MMVKYGYEWKIVLKEVLIDEVLVGLAWGAGGSSVVVGVYWGVVLVWF